MNADEMKEVLVRHRKWMSNEHGGIRADLRDANLCDANLRGAKNVNEVKWNVLTVFYAMTCPEIGSFIGWKKAGRKYIVKLRITDDAKRSSATSRKCRCSKAEVLAIETLDGKQTDLEYVKSDYDETFLYRVGDTVEVADFDDDRWNECSKGIHFFITREEALRYCVEHEECDYYIAKDCPREETWVCGVDCEQILMRDAADALEAAEKRIAELEEDLKKGEIVPCNECKYKGLESLGICWNKKTACVAGKRKERR